MQVRYSLALLEAAMMDTLFSWLVLHFLVGFRFWDPERILLHMGRIAISIEAILLPKVIICICKGEIIIE